MAQSLFAVGAYFASTLSGGTGGCRGDIRSTFISIIDNDVYGIVELYNW